MTGRGKDRCGGCGRAIEQPRFGARKWCSDKCRKRTLYSGVCEVCGGRTDGIASGKSRPVKRCRRCQIAVERQRSSARLIAAIQRWADEHGGCPPAATDWNGAYSRTRGESMRAKEAYNWPCVGDVQRVFGSWSAGIVAAGFEPRNVGTYGRDGEDDGLCAEIRKRYEAGESSVQLATAYGCSAMGIAYRVRKAGGKMRSHSEAQALRRVA